jgi:prevent-host-death family protein
MRLAHRHGLKGFLMPNYNVHEAKSNFSRLLKEVEGGEDVVIMRDGQPVAKLVRCRPTRRKKIQLGLASEGVWAAPGWEKAMTDAEVEVFLGGRL